jgi:hypothetical protein
MKPIKKIAGNLLLYFYFTQRTDTAKLLDTVLDFQMRNFNNRKEESPILVSKENPVIKGILKITDNANNLYNALMYLEDKGFIEMEYSPSRTCDKFSGFRVVSDGVDVIEGILRGKEEKQAFYTTFNIKLTDKIKLEDLLKF